MRPHLKATLRISASENEFKSLVIKIMVDVDFNAKVLHLQLALGDPVLPCRAMYILFRKIAK